MLISNYLTLLYLALSYPLKASHKVMSLYHARRAPLSLLSPYSSDIFSLYTLLLYRTHYLSLMFCYYSMPHLIL